MSRISAVFAQKGHKALIPYITTGYPRPDSTLEAVQVLAAGGADIVELGIPFSDPLADGATIQDSSYRALLNGITPAACLETASQIRQKTAVPLVFMTYFNPVMSYGIEKFCRDCWQAGIDGLIVPDLPPEEGQALEVASAASNLDLIYLLAPTSTEERINLVAAKSHGFIYLVSVAGVTGARNRLAEGTEAFIARVRKDSDLPLCVGFGISTPEQAARVAGLADGVIVGSRLIQLMKEDASFKSLGQFIKELRTAVDA